MSEWQPIETAPKDGLPLLAWTAWNDGGCVNIIQWDYEEDEWREWEGSLLDGFKIDHWMPLPSPPAAASLALKTTLRETNT